MSPKKLYHDQKHHALERGLEFLFSYEDWLEMWLLSGKWEQRGKTKGKYQMCRYNDEGSYSPRNCYIGTVERNQNDRSWHSDTKILAIVDRYLNSDLTQYEVAAEFGIDQGYVSRLVNKKRRAYAQNFATSY